jgi:hypothetical protein
LDQISGGDTCSPEQVKRTGMAACGGNAGLVTVIVSGSSRSGPRDPPPDEQAARASSPAAREPVKYPDLRG